MITEMHALPAWRALVEQRGWEDAFLTGEAFERFIAQDTRDTETVLRELGLAG
jgi:putative tricarboxylic transport membrane protein